MINTLSISLPGHDLVSEPAAGYAVFLGPLGFRLFDVSTGEQFAGNGIDGVFYARHEAERTAVQLAAEHRALLAA